MTDRLAFKVAGSRAEPYLVTFCRQADPPNFWVTCTCQAARRGLPCRHRLELVRGVIGDVVEFDATSFAVAHAWATADGRLLAAIEQLDALERFSFDVTPRELALAKARVATAILGRHDES